MKKVLFFIITIILGFMFLVVTYQGFYMSNVQGIIQTALDEENYDGLAKSFLPFFNKEEQVLSKGNGSYDLITYEALVGEQVKVKYGDKEVDANKYEEAIVLFVDNIEYTVDGVETADGKFMNHTSVTLYNGDKNIVYYFNDPMTATNGKAEGVKRFYTDAASAMKFVMLTFSKTLIDKELGGKITKIDVTDGHNKLVGTVDVDLDFDSTFYTEVKGLKEQYDLYLKDPNNQEMAKQYEQYYNTWLETYKTNENNGLGYVKGEISNAPVIWKTVGVMSAYIVICCVLGYYVLRKRPNLYDKKSFDYSKELKKLREKDQKASDAKAIALEEDKGTVVSESLENQEVKETLDTTNSNLEVEETNDLPLDEETKEEK